MIRIIYGLIILGIALVLYLSWVPNPDLHFVRFIPNWIVQWTNEQANEDLRTAVPFVGIGLLAGSLLSRQSDNLLHWLAIWLLLIGVVTIAEVGQLWLPKRHFSWVDIEWGATGSLAGLVAAGLLQKIKPMAAKRQ